MAEFIEIEKEILQIKKKQEAFKNCVNNMDVKIDEILSRVTNLNLFPDTRCTRCVGTGKIYDDSSTSLTRPCPNCYGTGNKSN